MRQTTSLSFALLLASGLFSAGGIAAPHGGSDNLMQRDTNLVNKRLTGQLTTIGQTAEQQRRSPEITEEDAHIAQENDVSETVVARDAAPGAHHVGTVREAMMMMARQYPNGTTPKNGTTSTNKTIAGPATTLSRRNVVVRAADLFLRQYTNGTTPTNGTTSTNKTTADPVAVFSGRNTVGAADLFPRQSINGTTPKNGTTSANETVADLAGVLGRRNAVVRGTDLFTRQYFNGTTPSNRTVTGPKVPPSRGGASASVPERRGMVVRTAVVLPRQYTNGTRNDTEIVF